MTTSITATQLEIIVKNSIYNNFTYQQALDEASVVLGFVSFEQFRRLSNSPGGLEEKKAFLRYKFIPLLLLYITSNSNLVWINGLGQKFRLIGNELAYQLDGALKAFDLASELLDEDENEEEPLFGFELINNINEFENVFEADLRNCCVLPTEAGFVLELDLSAGSEIKELQYQIYLEEVTNFAVRSGINIQSLIILSDYIENTIHSLMQPVPDDINKNFYEVTGVELKDVVLYLSNRYNT